MIKNLDSKSAATPRPNFSVSDFKPATTQGAILHRIFSRTPRDRISVMPGRRDMYAPIGGDDGAPEGGVQLSSVRAGQAESRTGGRVQLPFHAGGNGGELAELQLLAERKQRKMAGGIFCAAVLCVFLASASSATRRWRWRTRPTAMAMRTSSRPRRHARRQQQGVLVVPAGHRQRVESLCGLSTGCLVFIHPWLAPSSRRACALDFSNPWLPPAARSCSHPSMRAS